MNRRFVLTAFFAASCAALCPAQPVVYHSATGAQHQTQADTLTPMGYRMISLSMHGTIGSPRYAAVWVQRPGPAFVAFHGLDGTAYQTFADTWCPLGYTPKILTATGSFADPRFAGVYELTNETCETFHGLSETDFRTQIAAAADAGLQITTMDIYGTAGDTRYIVAFGPKTVGQGVEISTSVADMQADFDAYVDGHARPSLVTFNDANRFASLWRSDDIGYWVMHHDMTVWQYMAMASTYSQQGMMPISLHASGSAFATRYAAVWAYSDLPATPVFSVTGQAVPELAMFDVWAHDFMVEAEVRSANLAIVKDGRLVYARAFTRANPDYRLTQPTDVYRIASCSKPITSIAMHQHFGDPVAGIGPNDAMVDFMPGTIALDGWVSAIKIDHLLTHRPGWIPDYTSWQDPTIATTLGVGLPVTKRNTYDYVTRNRFLDYYPGTDSSYCNLGFNILGQIIENRNPGLSYAQVVQRDIFLPLGIWRARLGGSLRSEIPPEEVLYHPYEPSIVNSPVNAAQPLVSAQYGGLVIPNRDAQGGWVMAAADYAKVLASFDTQSPLLDATQTAAMWTLVSGTDATLRGWTLANVTDASGASVEMYGHNGRLIGSRSLIARRADGLAFVFFTNGDKTQLSVGLHGGQLSDLANTVNLWPNHDLFPSLGLPSCVTYTPGTSVSIGTGCFGSGGIVSLHVNNAPDVGQFVEQQISRAPSLAPSLLLVGFTNPNFALAPVGAPGCWLRCDPVLTFTTVATASGSGAFFNWQVPENPAAYGALLYTQGAVLDPPANALGLTTTNARRLTIGGWQ